jgi:Ataxin-2 C-terminal region
MDYKLNPDAKEFVPVHSPTQENFPTSTTPLSPDAPNFEPTSAEMAAAANGILSSGDLFGFESKPQELDFAAADLNPFGLNSAPIPEPVQLASPSFGMAETPSYAILENVGTQETPLATPQMPDAALWSANAVEHLQDPMQFIEDQFKQPSPVKEDFDLMSAVLEEAPPSPMQEAVIPDFIPEVPSSPLKEPMSPVLDDVPMSPIKFEAPPAPFQEQLLASPVSEGVISPPPPVMEKSSCFEENFAPEQPQQPDLIECLPAEPVVQESIVQESVVEETIVLDDILPVEKMIEEPVVLPEVQQEAPKAAEPLVEAPAILKMEAPEEPKVKTKLYRRKSKKIKGKF